MVSVEKVNGIERYLWPDGFRRDAWMIVDAARDRRIFGMLLDYFYSQHTCLFNGRVAPELELVAPYLVQLEYDDAGTRRFLAHALGNNWGVFLKCNKSMEPLRRHLQECLIAQNARGQKLMFRYYDPRVLRVYLPTCTTNELEAIFGPVNCFCVEGEKPDTLLEFRFDQLRLIERKFSLEQPQL